MRATTNDRAKPSQNKNLRFTEPSQSQERSSSYRPSGNQNPSKGKEVDMNNILNDIESPISEEDNNVSEGDIGSNNILNSLENEENNYFDRNTVFGNDFPRESEPPKKVHHLPRESSKQKTKQMKAEEMDFDDRVRGSYQSQNPSVFGKKPAMKTQTEESQDEMRPQPRATEKTSIKNIRLDNKTKAAIQIIRYDSHHHFEFNEEAEDILLNYEGNISFVALAGKYRTGKSFLLNKILEITSEKEGFKVDPSVDACTEGIWLWTQPIYNEKENTHIFFLDTEGSSSVSRDQKHDATIFALAILMSSIFVFNSVGCIDEQSINQLSLTTTLSNNIAIATNKGRNDEYGLSFFTPKFIWLLRDFTLEIQDQQGRVISPNQYLENALAEEKPNHKNAESNKKIRRSLLNYFKERECFTMVRPVAEESDLKKLNTLPKTKLRKEFLMELKTFKEKLFAKASPKQLNGVNLNSRMFCNMIRNFVEAINKGAVPNIASAWDFILENECINAHNDALELYNQSLKQYLSQDKPKSLEELFNILKSVRDTTLDKYQSIAGVKDKSAIYLEYRAKIKQILDSKETQAIKLNEEMASGHCKQILNLASQDDYEENSIGSKKSEILVEFLKNFLEDAFKGLISTIRMNYENKNIEAGTEKTIFKEKEANLADNIKTLEKKNQLHEDRIRKIEKEKLEIESQRNAMQINYEMLQKENESLREEIKQMTIKKDLSIKNMKNEIEELKKPKKKGGLFSCFSTNKKNKYK